MPAPDLGTMDASYTGFDLESGLVDSVLENARILQGTTPQNLDPVTTTEYVGDAVGPRAGFWVSLVALVLLAAGNLIAATRSRSPVRAR